jgi:cell division FtsZ-interacting protein ZapD
VKFPDPAEVAIRGVRVALLPLPRLVELKLASGISAPHRLRDLADVLELIRVADLSAELADELDLFVREKYLELWRAAQTPDHH